MSTPPLILLVDDDIDCLEVNRHFLEAAGFSVTTAFDPDEAWAKMHEQLPDLVVTDLMMGSIDAGFSFAKRIKQEAKFASIPVVVATAVGSQLGFDFRPRSEADLKAMSADAFLPKPVAPQTLVQRIQQLLAR